MDNPVKVYNFEVEDWHTYSVSKYGVLVHNTGTNPCAAGANASASGRAGKQARLKELANDDKLSSALRGEIKRDINEIAAGKRNNIRVPEGYNLAHRRGYEAKNGYGYEYSDLQDIGLHKLQHSIEGY